jgi:hypothetical protein
MNRKENLASFSIVKLFLSCGGLFEELFTSDKSFEDDDG